MSRTSCKIHFENDPLRVFYGGQFCSGRVLLKLFKEKTVRGIYVKIVGKGHCEWKTGSGKNRTTHSGQETYLYRKMFLVGSSSGEIVLQPGEYNYTFSCQLPENLPSSVEGRIGHIRYTATVNLDRPMWPDQEFKESLTVLKATNLNDYADLRNPILKQVKESYFICCLLCCCSTGPLSIKAGIPLGGYIPGQTIQLFLDIDNRSDEKFRKFDISIVKLDASPRWISVLFHMQYYKRAGSSRTTSETVDVVRGSCDGCNTNERKRCVVNVKVPFLPPTDYSTSNIVKVRYMLRVHGSAGFCRKDPVLYFPITIGTHPILFSRLSNTVVSQQPTPSAPYQSQNNHDPVRMPLLPPSDSNVDPPTAHPSAPLTTLDDGIDPPTYDAAMSGLCADANGKVFNPLNAAYWRSPSYSTFSNE